MSQWTVQPDVFTYSAAISSCGQWQMALKLFHTLPEAKIPPDLVSFSSVMTSLQKSVCWQRAFKLFEVIRESQSDTDADVATLGVAVRCCELAGDFPEACSLLQSMGDMTPGSLASSRKVSGMNPKALQMVQSGGFHGFSKMGCTMVYPWCTPNHPSQAVSVKGRVGLALDFDLTKTPARLGQQRTG